MIAGEGKKHGKEAIAGDMFPRSSTRTLAEHKARLGLPKSFVCERATPCLLVEKFIVERRLAAAERAAERAEERRLATEDWAAERTEERRLADERTHQHPSTHGSNNVGSKHAHGPGFVGNNLNGSPHL